MNKIHLIALTIAVLCVLEADGTTVTEFFNNLPADISEKNAFTSAWQNMKKSIKKPVRIKRLGRGGRRRKTSPRPSTTTTEATTTSSTYLMLKKLELPVLPTPKWRSLDEWKNLQKPRFALKSDGPSTPKGSAFGEVFDK